MKRLLLAAKGVTQVKGLWPGGLKAQHKTAALAQAMALDCPRGLEGGEALGQGRAQQPRGGRPVRTFLEGPAGPSGREGDLPALHCAHPCVPNQQHAHLGWCALGTKEVGRSEATPIILEEKWPAARMGAVLSLQWSVNGTAGCFRGR